MKILILSCRTGGGHDAAGLAVKEELEARGHEAVMFDYLTLAGQKVSDRVGDAYVNTVKTMPHAFGVVYRLGMVVSRITKKSPVYYANSKMGKYLAKYLEANHFDAILMPHLYPAETITYMKREGIPLPLTVAVMTDYTCIPFWEETDCDCYVIPHEELKKKCESRGIPGEKLIPLGIPSSRRFRQRTDKGKVRKYLGLPKEKMLYLLIGGSMGAGDLGKLAGQLWKTAENNEAIVVICGNNKKIFQKMKKQYKEKENIVIIGNTKQIDLYMKACDILYTKPGGLTSTEGAVCGIPMVHTAPIPGCETANRKFFVKHGMSIAPKTVEKQVSKGRALLQNQEQVKKMKENQKQNIQRYAAENIVKLIEEKGALH